MTINQLRESNIHDLACPGSREVPPRVVAAKLNRDGVFEVTLARHPEEDPVAGG